MPLIRRQLIFPQIFDDVLRCYSHTKDGVGVWVLLVHATDQCRPHPIKCSKTDIIPQDGGCRDNRVTGRG